MADHIELASKLSVSDIKTTAMLKTSFASSLTDRRDSTFLESCRDMDCLPPPNYIFQTRPGRRWQKMTMVMLPILPLTAMLIQSAIRLGIAVTGIHRVQKRQEDLKSLGTLSSLISEVQVEREIAIDYLNSLSHDKNNSKILQQIDKTKEVLAQVESLPTDKRDELQIYLNKARLRLLNFDAINATFNIFMSYSHGLDTLTNLYFSSPDFPSGGLMAMKSITKGIEQFDKKRLLGARYFLHGVLTHQELLSFIRANRLSRDYIEYTSVYDPTAGQFLSRRLNMTHNDVTALTKEVIFNNASSPQLSKMAAWFSTATRYIDAYSNVKDDLYDSVTSVLASDFGAAAGRCAGEAMVVIFVLVGFPLFSLIMLRVCHGMNMFVTEISERRQVYKFEKRKTDELLYQMLPKSVAMQMKFHKKVEAEKYDAVTVFFSDIRNFSAVSTISTPMQLVNLLNAVYNHIDNVIDRHDVYKVETISDVYMVCSGLPVRNGDNHVKEIANLSLDLCASMDDFKIPHLRQEKIELRIGLNSGPCVAGVVGTIMPRYCLFGDTVNVASRMQSNGLPMKIHISENTQSLLEKVGGYVMEYRGKVMIKGKGEMNTYWLHGMDESASRSASIRSHFTYESNGQPTTSK